MAFNPSPFSKPLGDVRIDDVHDLLGTDGNESLTWEAKSEPDGRPIRDESFAKVGSAFANSVMGGVLILGAEFVGKGKSASWHLSGAAHREEAPLWVQQKVSALLRPAPLFDVGEVAVGDGRMLLLVHFAPAPLGPCMTKDGRVYRRGAGTSTPISDPSELARLFDQTRAAGVEAANRVGPAEGAVWKAVTEGLRDTRSDLHFYPSSCTGFSLVVAPAAFGRSAWRGVFREDTVDLMAEQAGRDATHGDGSRSGRSQVEIRTSQMDVRAVHLTDPEQRSAFVLTRDGVGATSFYAADTQYSLDELVPMIRDRWTRLTSLMSQLEPAAVSVVLLTVAGGLVTIPIGPQATNARHRTVQRQLDGAWPPELPLNEMIREIYRSAGKPAWEPSTS